MIPFLMSAPALQAPHAADPFAPLAFLLGEWEGQGRGAPGEGGGGFSFRLELEGRILVRRNRSDYPATQGRPASHHEDVMTIFQEGSVLKALYLDNEGHVIRYALAASAEKVVLLSEPGPGPRFRLTYQRTGGDAVSLGFEIAPPGQPEAFAPYLTGIAVRKK